MERVGYKIMDEQPEELRVNTQHIHPEAVPDLSFIQHPLLQFLPLKGDQQNQGLSNHFAEHF